MLSTRQNNVGLKTMWQSAVALMHTVKLALGLVEEYPVGPLALQVTSVCMLIIKSKKPLPT
jgi:hypothetical protein